ncbi:hypothetical protein PHYBLDRAFT_174171 [Phycomyces blakesleeanus NRRL 1555(-)]|uniref:Uncharacterized protein n=1 Tax=Phycomyces blakesleeanus (strain ATCC 8743b / DSM 1359 / FGSC 10004 / NBRC 33097 / NRRL 1555) TaxID=763407 RepID=A0A162WJ43_PHYB8|nr:hypothetical protein PHYBLDRAFT_174171 [Phycomyces blakesleeanus NRRL 1555(-)]OAD67475.1 hypothetical protein PHYBLDRAFT_174171 [Phycomyces blakesleeanus NRRL 1555(-)]|eukprot:XP_018285515.1 hypothetical protein PHYBLDRAFT_174171 [Phycomyces blakesleeanus NRRL 1555(-)]
MRSSNVLVCYVDNAIRHWSMSVKAPRAYIGACGETLSLLEDLKKDHKATLRSEDISRLSFSHTIDLVIIRLVEGSHENIAAGRMYEETFELVNVYYKKRKKYYFCLARSVHPIFPPTAGNHFQKTFNHQTKKRLRLEVLWTTTEPKLTTGAYTFFLIYVTNIRAKSTFNIFFNNHAAALPKRNVSYRVQKKKK